MDQTGQQVSHHLKIEKYYYFTIYDGITIFCKCRLLTLFTNSINIMRIDLNIIFDLDKIHPTTEFGERFNIVLVHVEVTTESWYFLGKTYSKCCKKSHSYGFLKENIHKTKMIVCC